MVQRSEIPQLQLDDYVDLGTSSILGSFNECTFMVWIKAYDDLTPPYNWRYPFSMGTSSGNVHSIQIKEDEQVAFLSLNQKVRLIKYLIGDEKISWRYNRWKSMEQWINSAKIGSYLKLNLKWKLLRDRSKLILKKDKIDTDGFSLILKEVDYYKKSNNSYKETIDGSSIEGKKLKLREWKHGDSFQPLGMTGKKKISDLLIDKKIDFFHKEKQMVVTADKKIIWVCGYQISETVKVLDKTTYFMELSLK